MATTDAIKKLLTTYLRRLTNLSGNNRSLFLPRLSVDHFIDLHALSQLNGEKSFSIIEALIHEKKKYICPALDSRLTIANEATKKLKRLQRVDHFIFEERGSKDLHVGWPFIKGKFSDGTSVRCPLLFFPVELILENNSWFIKPRSEGEIIFNKSFLLAYSFFNKVKLNESLLEEDFESIDRDSTVFRTELYKMLQNAHLEINFNADNFRDELISFQTYTKTEFEAHYQDAQLKLYPEAILGIFPQAGSYLVPDYQTLLADDSTSDLEEFFYKRIHQSEFGGDLNFITKVKEEKVYPAFAMDIWQENALKAVKFGNSIVVEGPPGTGKSHLICNLIADAIAHKQRVLVVCQKRVALDVVSNRLKEKKLSAFMALVHDFKEDRKAIYQNVAKQVENIDEYKQKNNSLDAIQLERRFYLLSRKIDHLTEELEEFRSALFNDAECGLSIKELYLQSCFKRPYINLKQEFSQFRFDDIDVFLTKLKVHCHYAQRLLDESYEWRERKSFSSFGQHDFETIKTHLQEIPVYITSLEEKLHEQLRAKINWEAVIAFSHHSAAALEVLELIDNEAHFELFKTIIDAEEQEVNSLWLSNIERLISDCFDDVGPELSIDTANLGRFQGALYQSMKSRNSLFGMIRWELFAKEKVWVARALVANGLKKDRASMQQLERKLDRRLNLEHNLSKLRSAAWLMAMPSNYSLKDYRHWFQSQQRVIRAKNIFNSIRGITTYINPKNLSYQEFHARVKMLFEEANKLSFKKSIWLIYFAEHQISMFSDGSLTSHLEQVLRKDFSSLVEFDKQREGLLNIEKVVIEKLVEHEETWEYERLKRLLINSLSLSWIEHIENKYPILNCVSSGKIELLENELKESISEKLKISSEILLLRARENVTDDLEFNRLNNRVTYRDLLHQVTKKKKIWPLRKLVKEHSSELFKLMPCWLASPETVSAIFPMEEFFDLVIFDEASQCFVERGIPSMYRGKQVMIAGDSHQLKPSDLYQARWQEEDDSNPDSEIDSLLDLSKRYLLQSDLRHHYRSQSLALMEFSNQHFYQGKLKLLPDRNSVIDPSTPIEYHQLKGTWQDQTNEVEAKHIVSLVASLITNDPQLSVGVITFNAPQQNLIQDLFEQRQQEMPIEKVSEVFIKNIENVQGDESDIIIFSVGYAPNQMGKMAMQFGSLNQQGGENRLNVAITRAKKKIIIVASILPDQLAVEDTINSGPKLLKAYLKYAYQVSNGMLPSLENDSSVENGSLKKIMFDWCKLHHRTSLAPSNIPIADLTIQQSEIAQGLVLTDDELYKTSLSAKDHHALLPTTIEQKHWRLAKLYSRNYWQDSDKFFNDVAKFVSNP